MPHIVTVHTVPPPTKLVSVITVLTNVKLVTELLNTVPFVPPTDSKNQNVSAQKDSMITVIMLNVNLVPFTV